MIIEAVAQRFVEGLAGLTTVGATRVGSLRLAQTEAEGDEMTRAGRRFHMSAVGATGIAPVQAIPSTAAQWMIWNPASNTVSAFIDVIGTMLNSGTAGAGGTLWGCIVTSRFAPATVPTQSAANVQIMNASPVSNKASNLIVVSGQTLQNTAAGNWFPLAFMNPANTVLGQTQLEQRDIRGKHIIAPGTGLALAVISPTGTTPLFAPYATWHEFASDNE